jgi:glycosyltransferase involved in cell wall biosynthesis
LKPMATKRLLIVTHTFLPHVGGIERVVYEQGKRLMRHGFKVTVLTSRMNTADNYVVDDIRVHCYNSLNQAFGLGIPYPIPKINSFKPFLKRVNEADLVHVHGHPYLSSLYAAKLAKHIGKPVVVTQHNTFIEYESGFWDQVEWLNDATVGKQVLKSADKIITVSNATKRYVLSLGAKPEKTSVLHNGVDIDRFKPSTQARATIRRKLNIPRDATVILTVRRLVYKNGVDTLLESAQIAAKQNPKIVFLAVGKGPDLEPVQTRIRQLEITNNFKLAGFVPDAELPAFYNAADLFVLPSKSGEGLPLVALEAMSTGLPVIATDVGGIKEIMLKDHGRLVPPDDPQKMAKVILELAQTKLQAQKNSLHDISERKFGWEGNVKSLIEIYEELI